MSEKISIKNFLTIKKADLEIRKINILIGNQATGKSLIAKLLYFFRRVPAEVIEGIMLDKSKRELDADILKDFEKRFPKYTWESSSFVVEYRWGDVVITLASEKGAGRKNLLKISYSDNISKIFSSKKALYKKRIREAEFGKKSVPGMESQERHSIFYESVVRPLNDGEYGELFRTSLFVPASRTFFSNLQKNIFTFLSSNLDIDPFLKDFGSLYETSKFWYKDSYILKEHKALVNQLQKVVEAIIDGDYEYSDDQDWVVKKNKKVNLKNASSGQQESIPMLLVLSVWPILRRGGGMFFIEEPEAHLFPTSQGHVVSILSTLYSELGTKFFLTTHSPYILSAFNNLILANDVISEEKLTLKAFSKINGPGNNRDTHVCNPQ